MIVTEHRIKLSANQHEIKDPLNDGERVAMQAECEVSSTTTKPAGDGNTIAIYTLKPLAIEIMGIDPQYNTPKQQAEPKSNTPSKRLRSVIWTLWDQQYKYKYKNFQDYYEVVMDRLIDTVKEKLQ